MLTDYIEAAMRRASYEPLPDGGGIYGHIPDLPGVWANEETEEATRADLRRALEGWLVLGLRMGDPIPALDGIDLTFAPAAV